MNVRSVVPSTLHGSLDRRRRGISMSVDELMDVTDKTRPLRLSIQTIHVQW